MADAAREDQRRRNARRVPLITSTRHSFRSIECATICPSRTTSRLQGAVGSAARRELHGVREEALTSGELARGSPTRLAFEAHRRKRACSERVCLVCWRVLIELNRPASSSSRHVVHSAPMSMSSSFRCCCAFARASASDSVSNIAISLLWRRWWRGDRLLLRRWRRVADLVVTHDSSERRRVIEHRVAFVA